LGVVFAFSPPEDDVLDVVAVVELELEPLDPQPAASSSAAQAIATAGSGKPLLIGDDPFSADSRTPYHLTRHDGPAAPDPVLDRG